MRAFNTSIARSPIALRGRRFSCSALTRSSYLRAPPSIDARMQGRRSSVPLHATRSKRTSRPTAAMGQRNVPPTLFALVAAVAIPSIASASYAQAFERPTHFWFFVDPSVFGAIRTADARLQLRLRFDAGPAIVREPHYLSVGATFEYESPDRFVLASYGQYLDGSGGFGAGILVGADLHGTPVLGANMGFTWFFADAHLYFSNPIEAWVGLGLRVPLGGIAHRLYFARRPYRIPMHTVSHAPAGPAAPTPSPVPSTTATPP